MYIFNLNLIDGYTFSYYAILHSYERINMETYANKLTSVLGDIDHEKSEDRRYCNSRNKNY